MSFARGDAIGKYRCECGCECGDQDMTWYTDMQMKCGNCGCAQPTSKHVVTIRIYVHGRMTMKAMQDVLTLGETLGAGDEARLVRENDYAQYLVVPAEGIVSRLEIQRLTKPPRSGHVKQSGE